MSSAARLTSLLLVLQKALFLLSKGQPIPRTYHPRSRRTGPFSQDASWVLPPSSPLKCTAPSDVYLLLKSSDFVSHDLSIDTVFEGCQCDASNLPLYQLELVLRKWYPIDRSREFRCFVREGRLIGLCPFAYLWSRRSRSCRNITT